MPRPRSGNRSSAVSASDIALRGGIIAAILVFFILMIIKAGIFGGEGLSSSVSSDLLDSEGTGVTTEAATATISFTGDIIGDLSVGKDGAPEDTEAEDGYNYDDLENYNYTPVFRYIGTTLDNADFLVANLETTFSGTLSGGPNYSTPDALAGALANLGVDLLNTANEQALDNGTEGLTRTIDVLDRAGIDHVGTYDTQYNYEQYHGVVMEEINGINVAFLSFTDTAGDTPEEDWMVNIYEYKDDMSRSIVDEEYLTEAMDYAKSLNPDFTVVMVHWGTDLSTSVTSDQADVADTLIRLGADVIIGCGPHVPQSWVYRTAEMDDGSSRTVLVCYSLGALLCEHTNEYTDICSILNLTLERDTSGKTTISKVSYSPLYTMTRDDDGQPSHYVIDIESAISDYLGERSWAIITDDLYPKLQSGAGTLQAIYGEDWSVITKNNPLLGADEDTAEETDSSETEESTE